MTIGPKWMLIAKAENRSLIKGTMRCAYGYCSKDLGKWQQGKTIEGELRTRTQLNTPASQITIQDFPYGAESLEHPTSREQEEARILECAVRMMASYIEPQRCHNQCTFKIAWEDNAMLLLESHSDWTLTYTCWTITCSLQGLSFEKIMLVRVHISCWQQQCFAVVEGSHREAIAVFGIILKPKLRAEGTWNQAIYSSYFVSKGEWNDTPCYLLIDRLRLTP